MDLVVRTGVTPEAMTSALLHEVAVLDPEVPLFAVHTMEQALDRSLSTRRLTDLLLAGFALAAVLLATLGIYGVMSLNVNSRVNEFGIRLALGAQPDDVVRLVMRQGTRLALLGIGLGVAGALWLTRFLQSLLFGVKPTDPVTFVGVAVTLGAVAFAACYIPAR